MFGWGDDVEEELLGINGSLTYTLDSLEGVGDAEALKLSDTVFELTAMGKSAEEVLTHLEKVTGIDIPIHLWKNLRGIIGEIAGVMPSLSHLTSKFMEEMNRLKTSAMVFDLMRQKVDFLSYGFDVGLEAAVESAILNFEDMRESLQEQLAKGEISAWEFQEQLKQAMQDARDSIDQEFAEAGTSIEEMMEKLRYNIFTTTGVVDGEFIKWGQTFDELINGMGKTGKEAFRKLREQIIQEFEELQRKGNEVLGNLEASFEQLSSDLTAVFDQAGVEAGKTVEEMKKQIKSTQQAASTEFEKMKRLFEIAYRTGSDEALDMAMKSRKELSGLVDQTEAQMEKMVAHVEKTYGKGSEEAKLFRIFANDEVRKIRTQYNNYLLEIEDKLGITFQAGEDGAWSMSKEVTNAGKDMSSNFNKETSGMWEGLDGSFDKMKTKVSDTGKVIVNDLGGTWTNVKDEAAKSIEGQIGDISRVETAGIDSYDRMLFEMKDSLNKHKHEWDALKGDVADVLGEIRDIGNQVFDRQLNKGRLTYQKIKDEMQKVIREQKSEWSQMQDEIRQLFQRLKTEAVQSFEQQKNAASSAYNSILGIIRRLVQMQRSEFQRIENTASRMYYTMERSARASFNNQKSQVYGLSRTMSSVFHSMRRAASNFASSASRSVYNFARSARNAARDARNAVNHALGSIRSNVGSMGSINVTSSIRQAAHGAIAYGSTILEVGEYAGASSNPEVIAPLSDLEGILSRSMGGGGRGGAHQTIVINLDGEEIARSTARNLPEYLELLNLG